MRRILKGDQTPTARLDVGEGDWVVFKTRLSLSDRDFINAAMTERYVQNTLLSQVGGQRSNGAAFKQVGPDIDLSRTNTVTLLRALVEWGGPGFCVVDHGKGGPEHNTETQKKCVHMPITEANVAGLDEETAQLILNEIGSRNPAPVQPVPLES